MSNNNDSFVGFPGRCPIGCNYPTVQDTIDYEMTMGELAKFYEIRRMQLPSGAMTSVRFPQGLDPADPLFMYNVAKRVKENQMRAAQAAGVGDEVFDKVLSTEGNLMSLIQMGLSPGKTLPVTREQLTLYTKNMGVRLDVPDRNGMVIPYDEMKAFAEKHPDRVASICTVGLSASPSSAAEVAAVKRAVETPPWTFSLNGLPDSPAKTLEAMLQKQAVETLGISPELLSPDVNVTSMSELTTRWQNQIRNNSKPNALAKYMEYAFATFAKAATDYLGTLVVTTVKDVRVLKAKRVHATGSMRNKRRRHYYDLTTHQIVTKRSKFSGVFPVSIGEMVPVPGTDKVEVTATFQYDKRESTMAGSLNDSLDKLTDVNAVVVSPSEPVAIVLRASNEADREALLKVLEEHRKEGRCEFKEIAKNHTGYRFCATYNDIVKVEPPSITIEPRMHVDKDGKIEISSFNIVSPPPDKK